MLAARREREGRKGLRMDLIHKVWTVQVEKERLGAIREIQGKYQATAVNSETFPTVNEAVHYILMDWYWPASTAYKLYRKDVYDDKGTIIVMEYDDDGNRKVTEVG